MLNNPKQGQLLILPQQPLEANSDLVQITTQDTSATSTIDLRADLQAMLKAIIPKKNGTLPGNVIARQSAALKQHGESASLTKNS